MPSTRLDIPGGRGPMAAILVGPRADGSPRDEAGFAELREVASLVASAIALHVPAARRR